MLFGYFMVEEEEFKKSLNSILSKLLFMFIETYAIPVGISVYGSYRLKILLKERRNLVEENDSTQPPSTPLATEMEESDQRLDKGLLFLAYKAWLYLASVLGIYFYAKFYKLTEAAYYNHWEEGEDSSSIFYWGSRIYSLHCLFYFMRQAWFEMIAMRQRDLKTATKVHNSLVWLVKYSFIWIFINLLNFGGSLWPMTVEENIERLHILIRLSTKFVKYILIPMGISIYGSKKVKTLLEEKEKIIQETTSNEKDSSPSKYKI